MVDIYAKRNIGVAEVQIVIGDIVNQADIGTIVNATNSHLHPDGGVSGAVFQVAGADELTTACRKFAPINVGEAIITPGFSLPNSNIIHCCGPNFKSDPDAEENLSSCYWKILSLAAKSNITSLAIPAISTGAYAFPVEDATRICIKVIKEASPDFGCISIIRFVIQDEATAIIYSRYLFEEIPLPENATRIVFDARFSNSQFQRIRKGFIGDQDNKWFMYFDDPWLYVFRASRWVGQCWFFLKFESIVDDYKVAEAWADSDSLRGFNMDFSEFLYTLIDDYLPGGHNYISFVEDGHGTYRLLRNGKIDISLSLKSISIEGVRKLGDKLIGLSNQFGEMRKSENPDVLSDRFRGAMLGMACGDAVGTTVEFMMRGTFTPVTDMIGGGPFNLKPGEWTDDTSMGLCLATSLIECGSFDASDQMRRYVRWRDDGYLSSNGLCFDIGFTTSTALEKFKDTGNPFSGSTDKNSAGNGCIMRLAPVPLFFYPDRDAVIEMSGESSRTTHGAIECIEASRLFGAMIFQALNGSSKEEILLDHGLGGFSSNGIQEIAQGIYREKIEDEIFGTGYVVPSLEAALWCFYHTDNFKDAILRATNLGKDADTTAAICGQLAGAFYGESGIPESWRKQLAMHDEICVLADRLCKYS